MRLRRCPSCWEYTFKEACTNCNSKTENPAPPKFSPEDKYGEYRRRMLEK